MLDGMNGANVAAGVPLLKIRTPTPLFGILSPPLPFRIIRGEKNKNILNNSFWKCPVKFRNSLNFCVEFQFGILALHVSTINIHNLFSERNFNSTNTVSFFIFVLLYLTISRKNKELPFFFL